MYVTPGDADGNLSRATELIKQAAKQGAQIVLLPEALPFGWMDPSAKKQAESIPEGEQFALFSNLAADHGVYLCSGLVERAENRIFNSAVLLSPQGELLLHHRKINE